MTRLFIHFFWSAFAFLYSSDPFLQAQKPLILRAARAAFTATIQELAFPRWLAFLLTTLPALFFTRSPFLRPPLLLSAFPENTWRLSSLAETTFFAFIAFMAFVAFMAAMMFWKRFHKS